MRSASGLRVVIGGSGAVRRGLLREVAVASASTKVVLHEEAVGLHQARGEGTDGLSDILLAHLFVALALDHKAAPALEDGVAVTWLELKEVDKGGEDVEEEAAEQYAVQAGCGEVLVDHQEVVPEVEEDLPWTLCREAGTTDVVDDRGGGEGDAMPAGIESPA